MDLQGQTISPTQRLQLPLPIINRQLNSAIFFFFFFLFLLISSIALFTLFIPLDQTQSLFTFRPSTLRPKQQACDYSRGRWVRDSSNNNPSRRWSYYDEGCPFLDPGFRCRQNGRNDVEYLKWRWQPHGCDLPRFNASNFLESVRNGRVVFAGDSIGRNQWESLICMLSEAVPDASSSIYEENGNPISKHKGYLSIRFRSHNLTVEYYRAPFLMRIGRPPSNSPSQVKTTLRVDELNVFAKKWIGADVVVFNTGHWWNHDKTLLMGCYFQEGGVLNMTMDVTEAFRRSVATWKSWVMKNFDLLHRSRVMFRSFSPIHYSNGTWNEGGECSNNTKPETNYGKLEKEPAFNFEIAEAMKEMGKNNAHFLNVTFLSDIRKDGHPSSHREPGTPMGAPEDCSHWCLPGVPDTWNELLYALLLSDGFVKN